MRYVDWPHYTPAHPVKDHSFLGEWAQYLRRATTDSEGRHIPVERPENEC